MQDIIILLLLIGALVLFIWIKRKTKMPKVGSLCLVTGAVKSGKTTFSLALAISTWKRAHRRWKIVKFLRKIFGIKKVSEEPLLYSNIKLRVPYVPITKDLIERKTRPNYGSVFYISEASLLADNLLFKDAELSERVMLFNKLFGHETCGGFLVYDTQAIGDMPCVTRRCLGQYFYVHHIQKVAFFWLLVYVKECRYSEDGSVVSVDTEDIEDGLKMVLIRRSVWKKFNCYCYSSFTDDLPVENTIVKHSKDDPLLSDDLVSFKKYKTLNK